MVTYLGERNIAIFSTDIDSFDSKMHKPDQVIKSVLEKLQKRGKGIVLMHDFQRLIGGILRPPKQGTIQRRRSERCSSNSSSMATRSCT